MRNGPAGAASNRSETELRATLQAGIRLLGASRDTAHLDAEVLLAHVLSRPRHYPYLWPHRHPAPEEFRAFMALIKRRARGEPVAYLTGKREFWSLEFAVGPATLIPRPETETLVEVALGQIPPAKPWTVADLGTGCGAVAITLALERPQAKITASDVAAAALAVAQSNGQRHGATRLSFRSGSWFEPFAGERYHTIVSNPPYVADDAFPLDCGDTRFEPQVALRGGSDGMDCLRAIAEAAPRHLLPGGNLVLEHGHDQGHRVRRLLRYCGYVDIRTHRDHGGHERVTRGTAPATETCTDSGAY